MNFANGVVSDRNGALEMRFHAYPKRQFVTESININSLEDHQICATIKTLPATLTEANSMDRETWNRGA